MVLLCKPADCKCVQCTRALHLNKHQQQTQQQQSQQIMQDVLQHLQLRFFEKLVLQCTAATLKEGNKSKLQVHLLHCGP